MIHTMQLILFKDVHHFCAVANDQYYVFNQPIFESFKENCCLSDYTSNCDIKGKTLLFKFESAVNLVLMLKGVLYMTSWENQMRMVISLFIWDKLCRQRVKYANLSKYVISDGCLSNFTIFVTHVLDFNTYCALNRK